MIAALQRAHESAVQNAGNRRTEAATGEEVKAHDQALEQSLETHKPSDDGKPGPPFWVREHVDSEEPAQGAWTGHRDMQSPGRHPVIAFLAKTGSIGRSNFRPRKKNTVLAKVRATVEQSFSVDLSKLTTLNCRTPDSSRGSPSIRVFQEGSTEGCILARLALANGLRDFDPPEDAADDSVTTWRSNSTDGKLLRELYLGGVVVAGMRPADVKAAYPQSKKYQNLRLRKAMNDTDAWMDKSKNEDGKIIAWSSKSEDGVSLGQLLERDAAARGMSAIEIKDAHPRFEKYRTSTFSSGVYSAKARVKRETQSAA